MKGFSNTHSLYANADYKFTDKTDLSLSYNAEFTPKDDNHGVIANSYFGDRTKNIYGKGSWHDISLDFTHKNLKSTIDYLHYETQSQRETLAGNDSPALAYFSRQLVNRIYGDADWAVGILKNTNLLIGGSGSYSRTLNTIRNDSNDDGASESNAKSDEYQANVYAGISGNVLGHKLTYRATVNSRYYHGEYYHRLQFYPHVSVTWVVDQNNMLMARYSWSRTYPSYWDSQDQTVRDDDYIVSRSHTDLRPSVCNFAVLTYLFRNKYMLQVSYMRNDDQIFLDMCQNPEKLELISENRNLDVTSVLDVTVSAPLRIGQWYYGNFSFGESNWYAKCSELYGGRYKANKWSTSISTNHSVTLSRKPMLSLDVLAFYKSKAYYNTFDYSSFWRLDAGIKWQFCNKHALLSLQATDIFKTGFPILHRHILQQWQDYDASAYNRSVCLTFTYKFRDFKEKNTKEVDTSRMGVR